MLNFSPVGQNFLNVRHTLLFCKQREQKFNKKNQSNFGVSKNVSDDFYIDQIFIHFLFNFFGQVEDSGQQVEDLFHILYQIDNSVTILHNNLDQHPSF